MSAWRPAILPALRSDREYRDGRPEDWRDSAACASTDPELFFPDKGGSSAKAKATCATCPALQACREWALADPHLQGIAGGMSERERRKWRTEQRRKESAA